ncbi:phosphatidylinositol kinase- protein kinase tor1 [Coemansia spiralis]|uniref:Serine/threonine-protein kinase TOR n=2 Tax=Coemansia TaxID=4863 RepID=A0A9W8G2K2_9FUNG|nr:phosphatidylinositol kinase- protein kinase tor1 [Coemansia umbellata]KAJ2619552.1 phosphatidylinositol kinase- protein kinase tor1 [Coemansia sp. RSA 1358]KAJ2671504.1 phosphatidylinositol kinase- protein kinase tor1 [Coemansia spiralis]
MESYIGNFGERTNATETLRKLVCDIEYYPDTWIVDAESSGKHGGQNPVYIELNAKLMKLIRSSDTNDRLACTAILSALVDIDVLEDTQKTRIASQLKNLYSGNSSTVNAEAVDIYGKLVQKKWAVVMSSIEVEVNRCLEWLSGDRSEVRKMTALRLIEVLCIGAPTSLYTFTSRILNAQSALLRDHRLKIRNATARTLGICLDLVLMHEPATRNTLFSHLIDELHNNYQLVSIEGHHAALLICQELMLHGDILIKPNYNHIGKMVLDLKDHRDPVIYTTTINILPMLAQFSPQDFIKVDDNGESLMTRACGFLIAKTSGGDADRAAAFLALARIAQSCSLEFQEFLEPTTSAIRDALVQRIKLQSLSSNSEANDSADAILETIAILASAMGQMLTAYILKVLDLMFVTGLSQTLCKALSVLAVKVNQLQPVIQNKLLDMLSIILVDVPFRPNQPSLDRIEQQLNTLSIQNSTTINTSSLIGSSDNDDLASKGESASLVIITARSIPVTHDILLLALRTLSTFDFRQENLFEFVHKAVLQYFDHSSTAVRKEAMCAASQLVLASSMHLEMSGAGSEVTGEVAQRLVAAAVTDLDSDVRLNAVKVLLNSTGFDFHMGRGQVIQSIALLVNDELFEIRLTVLSIIGRLASVNPANIIPIIHRIVTRLLVELEFADANSEREECVQLLTVLVCSAESWMRPHVDAIIHTILPRIDDCPPRLSSKLLDTVGILARISGSDLVPHLDRLLSRIINALSDQKSTQKRLSALRALGSCASFCGMVIDPYLQYPQIFVMLTDMLKSEPDSDVRLEVVRVIGALGAIDPHKYRGALETAPDAYSRVGRSSGGNITDNINVDGMQVKTEGVGKKHSSKRARKKSNQTRGPPSSEMAVLNDEDANYVFVGDIPANVYGKTFTCDEHYTSVTVGVLLSILDDVSDTASDQYAVQALISMFVILKNACAPYLERVIPAILHAMRLSPLKQPEFFIRNLARLASINKSLIRSYAAPLLELYEIDESISDQQKAALIDLIEVLDDALSGNFGQHISTVLSFLIAVISANTSESLHITQRALYALQIISPSVESYLYLVVPRLISLLDLTLTPISTIKADLECISTIVSATDCSSFASRIVLTLVRMLQSKQSQPVQTDIMDTLCTLMENIQDRFVVFMPTISAVIKTRNLEEHAKYKEYSRQLFTGQLVLNASQPVKPALRSTSLPNESNYEAGDSNSSEQYVDESLLKRAWRTRIRMTKDDCIGWLNNLFVELLQQSPSPALRACSTNLAVKIPKLINELFNIAFVSCWTVLSEQNQQELAKSLEIVAANPNAPSEILQTILSLADFMERDGKKLPIDIKIIGNYASRCHALAKELRYKETEWVLGASYDTIEKLIELNQNLNLNDSAIGMLSYVRAVQPNIKESVEWYVRLQRWDEALAIYKRQEVENGPSDANLNGQIRCLFEMSDWESLVPIYSRIWCSSNPQLQQETAGIGVKVAWAVGDIDQMELCLSSIPNTNKEKPFCNALLSVYKNNFSDALQFISECRKQLETTLDSHSTDLYSQGYSQVFDCQMLTELEEVIEYKNSHKDYERQAAIVSTWKKRLDGIQPDVGMWQKLLRLHGMVLRPVLDLDTWIRYINLCRASGLMKMARRAIFQVLEDEAKFMEQVHYGEIDEPSDSLRFHAQEYARLREQHAEGGNGISMLDSSSGNSAYLDTAVRRSQQPVLIYSYLKYKWAANERKSAFQMLEMFSNDYANKIGFDLRNPCAFENHVVFQISSETNGSSSFSEDTSLAYFLARFYLKRAEWLSSIQQHALLAEKAKTKAKTGMGSKDSSYIWRSGNHEQVDSQYKSAYDPKGVPNSTAGAGLPKDAKPNQFAQEIDYLFKLKGERIDESILEFYQAATVLDRKWYKAWHSLALRHYHETQKYDGEHADVPKEIIEKHVVPAVHGFFRAIQLSRSQTTLQDTLRLLTAWFTYAQHESVAQAVLGGLKMVPLRTWLQVIPQILARIHIGFESTNKLIRQLLVEVGKFHPHALLFSLYVAARSDHPGRSHAAKDVLGKLHGIYPELIEETEVVSRELIRVALPLPEMWVDEVIKVNEFIQTNDIAEGIKLLMPMHARMRTLETPYEYHFAQVVGKELLAAEQLLTQYYSAAPKNRSMIILHKAWDVYRRVHALSEQVSNTRTLYLDQVAPILLQCNSMHLAVPGTYDPDYEIVRIESFVAEMSVHRTKQRPREMYVCGSDGRKYIFLLKGHEDLRQDERAMQLFGLINSLLLRDDETARRSLAIERYPVIPLSPRSGLIGYYPNCNNLYRIIEKYRKAHNQSARLEQFVAAQFAPNYEQLSALQKVEAFEYVLASTKGNDLQHVMWYQSPNADVWLERRTNYTRTMAVMSIVGYILGLGDRHLSNIMMHMKSGKIVHIDFGDCFEVAAHRKQCPEKVPFRLTRMVILPMEVSMIEGLFKFTANHVMRVLRANRDPVMAVLEAFVFDPLVVWAYIQDSENNNNKQQQQQQQQLETAPEAPAATSQGKQPQGGGFNADVQAEDLKARAVVKRIHDKLLGRDFDANVALSVNDQVDKLIQQATMAENLAPLFCGWQPFW